MKYCKECSTPLLEDWKGWPHKDLIPILQLIDGNSCRVCGGKDNLDNEEIHWHNHHGPYNTGLPDYWLLKYDLDWSKWGLPYYKETNCVKCSSRAVISQMKFPNGTEEFKINCKDCGILKCAKPRSVDN